MVSLVVDWFVRLGGVGMAGAIFHPTVGPESLRCAGAMLLGGFMADESHG